MSIGEDGYINSDRMICTITQQFVGVSSVTALEKKVWTSEWEEEQWNLYSVVAPSCVPGSIAHSPYTSGTPSTLLGIE